MDTSGHMTNKKCCISISTRPVVTKLDRMLAYDKESHDISHVLKRLYISTFARPVLTKVEMVIAYEKGSPPFMISWYNSHVTNKKSYIFVFTWLMANKFEKVLTYGTRLPCTIRVIA